MDYARTLKQHCRIHSVLLTLLYIPFFLKASIEVDSAVNDIDMFGKLIKNRDGDAVMADKALAS